MPTYQLELIPKQSTCISVTPLLIEKRPVGMFAGHGDIDYICGACEVILLGSLDGGVSFVGMPIHCGLCGAYNLMNGKRRPEIPRKTMQVGLPQEYHRQVIVKAVQEALSIATKPDWRLSLDQT